MNTLLIQRLIPKMPLRYIIRSASTDADVPNFDMENPFEKEKPQCILCKHKIVVDYKNIRLLSQFQSSYTGQIYGRHITGLCKKQQELLETEIKKAQNSGMMGFYTKEPIFLQDPELYDVERPIRPHRF
ncbi:unnamed protein product [Phyllotreta striolata]|uniref:28S ribosomal protein S18c, mitochondrial n=1 Tax=Phyllotreta striolata TaxID=444603 RepID=A0A9N9TNB9_PHYSR|nr:unnamed protein product [Phyllotreta striolata]